MDFRNWHYFLPECDTLVPKHVDDASLILHQLSLLHLIGVINGAL
jgi:hypothetical protein